MFSWSEPDRLPLIVAHRGSSSRAPENTLASFQQAIDDGADAVECDVRLTRDGQVVVIHDANLRRTTDGRGLVMDQTLRELRQLSAGRWFHRKYAAERIPTLDEVLALTAGRCGVNIEIKADARRHAGEIVDLCGRVIRNRRAQDRVLISSFSHRFVRNSGLLRPRIATGLLFHPFRHLMKPPVLFARSLGARYLIMNGSALRRRIVEEAHSRKIFVGEYTVNSARRWKRTRRFGVDAVFTDSPASLVSS
jgi:glycerophosphoryl diester phosphodiesterase